VSWVARRRERMIALLLLDQRPHVVAQTIAALARRNAIPVDEPQVVAPPSLL
jgi:hypothetical protein